MFQKFREKKLLSKISAFKNIDGWLTDKEAQGLYIVASKLPANASVVEIGSWQGKSTYCIAKGLKSGVIYCIDPFNADGGMDVQSQDEYNRKKGSKDLLESFSENMQQLDVINKLKIKKGYSYQFSEDFSKIDFLFIDGDHSIEGCKMDFDMYASKIISGGYIAFHDYYHDRPELGPTHVIDNIVSISKQYRFFKQYDSLWIAQKII
ncbi:MAG: class I SAM-dependent methyltransferase [Agriterribacter sp.]